MRATSLTALLAVNCVNRSMKHLVELTILFMRPRHALAIGGIAIDGDAGDQLIVQIGGQRGELELRQAFDLVDAR